MNSKKGQGMFEYILLLAGILLIVVLAIVVLRGGLFGGAEKDVVVSNCQAGLSRLSVCYSTGGAWANGTITLVSTPSGLPSACQSGAGLAYMDNYKNCSGGTIGCANPPYYNCGPRPG